MGDDPADLSGIPDGGPGAGRCDPCAAMKSVPRNRHLGVLSATWRTSVLALEEFDRGVELDG